MVRPSGSEKGEGLRRRFLRKRDLRLRRIQ
jgi:hypothetical protein